MTSGSSDPLRRIRAGSLLGNHCPEPLSVEDRDDRPYEEEGSLINRSRYRQQRKDEEPSQRPRQMGLGYQALGYPKVER